ncbi:MAG: hypothetical protein ACJATF_002214 [Flavobacteriales bacterium]
MNTPVIRYIPATIWYGHNTDVPSSVLKFNYESQYETLKIKSPHTVVQVPLELKTSPHQHSSNMHCPGHPCSPPIIADIQNYIICKTPVKG